MKKRHMLFLLPLLALLCVGAGPCATMESQLYDKVIVYETNYVPHLVVRTITNVVEQILITTNQIGQMVTLTNYVQVPIVLTETNYVQQTLTQTNLVTKEIVKDTLDATGSLIPVPFADTATALLGLFIGGYAAWRNRRNKSKAAQVAGSLVESIGGIRKVVKTLPNGEGIDDQIVNTLKDIQNAMGTRQDIHAIYTAKKADPTSRVE